MGVGGMDMELGKFKKLSMQRQADLLKKQGLYIGKTRKNSRVSILYQVERYYVEVFYLQYRKYIGWITCFTTTRNIDPYLKEIDISEISQLLRS